MTLILNNENIDDFDQFEVLQDFENFKKNNIKINFETNFLSKKPDLRFPLTGKVIIDKINWCVLHYKH